MSSIDSNRLKILSDDEIKALYARPNFTPEERVRYFALSPEETSELLAFPIESRFYCILELGYFKARQQFFTFSVPDVQDDLDYIRKHYYPAHSVSGVLPSRKARSRRQRIILTLCRYKLFDDAARQAVEKHATQLAVISSKPIYLLRESINFIANKRIVLPAYSTLQDLIGHVLEGEKQRLIQFATTKLTQDEKQTLQTLLTKPDGLYEVTRLKRPPRDFGFREMQQEIARGEQLHDLHQLADRLLPLLTISNEGVKYYASLVTYYSTFRLQQLDQHLTYIYLLCFAHVRYQQFQDNLITYFIYQVRTYSDDARQDAQRQLADFQLERNRHLPQAGQVMRLFTDETIAPTTPFGDVQSRAFELLAPDIINQIADDMMVNVQLDETELQWNYLDSKAQEFKRRLRRVIRTVPFATTLTDEPLMEALRFLKTAFQTTRALWHYPLTEIPTAIVPEALSRYLYMTDKTGNKRLRHDRFEFFVYRTLRQRLEAGDIFCRASFRFRSLEDDLLSDEQWQQRDALIARAQLPLLKHPIKQQLAELKERLELRLEQVNKRIADGENEFVTITKRGKETHWSLSNPTEELPVNHPFFDPLPLLDIHAVLQITHAHTRFLETFDHILHRYGKKTPDMQVLTAVLVAWGANLGVHRMAAISNIALAPLLSTSSNFIHLETLKAANDVVVNATAQLPVFPLFSIDDSIHSSSDGQKFETRLHTLNARYSPKYFGLQKGIVSYTLVANHLPLHAQIIGANEHESHFVFDILHNNTTDVQPTMHSTDTHGANHVNFALLHLFGYQFAPRYKDFPEKVRTSLYGFQHPSQYDDGWLLKPIRKLQEPLIIDEWDNFQRIILSLALKTTTQSVIVGKLSSYARSNRTKRALWEYDNIIRSLYLLDYIDLPALRINVQRALNRGESYHQLKRAISYANFGKLRYRTEYDQQLWNTCAQLITNCVIFYNSLLLSEFMAAHQANHTDVASQLRTISPVAWRHINFYGRYQFDRTPKTPKLSSLISHLKLKPE